MVNQPYYRQPSRPIESIEKKDATNNSQNSQNESPDQFICIIGRIEEFPGMICKSDTSGKNKKNGNQDNR
jgi:hypothetical protein